MGRKKDMVVRFFTMEAYHGKRDVGSTRIRAHNLIKYWDEADLYRYGDNADVMIYQKVYTTFDYKFQQRFEGLQILDICDPDWKDTPDIFIKETVDTMDAVVVPTENMRDYLQKMTDTPVRIIKDRFDLSEFPEPKVHKGTAKIVVWFGYAHNAEAIKFAIPSLENRGLKLIIVSNEDPACYRWANDSEAYKKNYTWIKYRQGTAYENIQKADLCLMMGGFRPLDIFKSENKTVTAQLLGIPVINNADDLDSLMTAEARNENIKAIYDKLKQDYDVRKSVDEYKELIGEITSK